MYHMHGIILKQIAKYEMIFRSNAAYNQLHYFLKLSVTAELERAEITETLLYHYLSPEFTNKK